MRSPLSVTHPKLIKEWHSNKNALSPDHFTPSSGQQVWWQCIKNEEHIWEARIRNRVLGSGCLYCTGKLVSPSESLANIYPSIAQEWHPTKNGSLTPNQIRFGSSKSAWWRCLKGHEWEARITNRTCHQSGCPYCSNKKAGPDNCLAITCPELAKEWHPTKNGDLTPYNIVAGSNKKIWWLCKHKHEWCAPAARRLAGIGCARCSGRKASPENCLSFSYPKIAEEWHPTKNGTLNPDQYVPGSATKVWWQCSINKTHEWEARIQERVGAYCRGSKRKGTGCPHCFPQISDAEYRLGAELKIFFPALKQKQLIKGIEADILIEELSLVIEIDGAYFHKGEVKLKKDHEKNKRLEKYGYNILRLRGHGLEKISEHDLDFDCSELKISDVQKVLNKIKEIRPKSVTPDVEKKIKTYLKEKSFQNEEEYQKNRRALPGKFTLGNLQEKEPDLAAEWHPLKNGSLLPDHFSLKSGKLVWWLCKKGHEWAAKIASRANGGGCPYCSNKKVCKENCLQTINPVLAAEWHPSKNGSLTPKDVVAHSNKKIWWLCSNNPVHEWRTSVDVRHREKTGCPYCSGKAVDSTNCLATINPVVAVEWHPTKNQLTPYEILPGSHEKVWWKCDKNKSHEWEATIDSRNRGNKCPYCSGRSVHLSNCLATVNPILAAEWHPTKNGHFTPYDFTKGSKKIKIWWMCTQGHEYKALILTRSHGHGCPECARETKRETALKRWAKYRHTQSRTNN